MLAAERRTPLNPNEIEAAIMDMKNKGRNAVFETGWHLSLSQWRDHQLLRWQEHIDAELGKL
jgi:hypothetical protein